ncbi:hypothetical protein P0092_07285 [Ruminiclostridium papyrosolvens DSM 2782]|uniref:hypothetical protein n=1 Tax=Ruminiclostridium papyrosolvens TaxID=29362 RepID=UPI0023E35E05|nr:hypothetical protein [Ruminiclostridium papyrosolvens]WES35762.1 hypothetical protein P0092_07285 [Ruminiclostridium papyrosolvens DSM 2782]
MEKTKGYPAYAIRNAETLEMIGFCWLSAITLIQHLKKPLLLVILLHMIMLEKVSVNSVLKD